MITVYIWHNRVQTAHASLHVSSDHGEDAYLSFHPQSSGHGALMAFIEVAIKSLVSNFPPSKTTLREDYDKYGSPFAAVELEKLDEVSMIAFIDEIFKENSEHRYNLYWENCSTTVGLCLIKGFAKLARDFDMVDNFKYRFEATGLGRALSHYDRSAHSKLSELMFEELPEKFAMASARVPRLRPIAVSILLVMKEIHSFVWDPDDVLRFAKYIKNVEND